jgi:hypothetical protein
MTSYPKYKKPRVLNCLTVFFLFALLFILVIGSTSCRKAKKEEVLTNQSQKSAQDIASETTHSSKAHPSEDKAVEQKSKAGQDYIEATFNRLRNAFVALEDAIQRIPRESFDPEAIIQKFGGDSIQLFEWVRDETFLIPYQGSLRGPGGVLMDRKGNSLDRSLLLCEMLLRTGQKARLATRYLSENEMTQLRKSLETRAGAKNSASRPKAFQLNQDLINFYTQNYGLDQKYLVQAISQAQMNEEKKIQELRNQYKELATEILSLVNKQVKNKPGGKEGTSDEALRHHWWVQWEKEGQWIDLDPSLPEARPGQNFGQPEKTLAPEELDETLFHTVKIRLVAEQFEAGNLKEKLMFEHTLVPSQLLGKQIVLRHLPLNWFKDEDFLMAQNPEAFFKEAVAKQTEWLAVLEIDGQTVKKAYVGAAGTVSDKPSQKARPKKRAPSGPAGLFSGLVGEKEEAEEEKIKKETSVASTELTAEWIEFEIYSPGQQRYVERREIFDFIGPAMRRGGNLKNWKLTEKQKLERAFKIMGVTEILPLACGLTSEFIQELTATYLLLHRDVYLNLVENYGSWEPERLFEEISELRPFPAKLYSFALKRFSLSPFAKNICLSSPNLFARHLTIGENEREQLVKMETLDIITNDVTVIGQKDVLPFSVGIEQGIFDTLLEASEMNGEKAIDNAASLFSLTKAQGIDWILIQGVDDLSRKHLRFPKDIQARLEQEVSRGFILLVPEKEILIGGKSRYAWWRLHPATGNFLGLGEKGAGQALAEYAEKAELLLQIKSMIEYYALIGECLGKEFSAALLSDKQEMRKTLVRCIWLIVCTNAAGVAEGFLDIETNWTNVIIKATLDWAMGSLCEGLWEKGIDR